MLKIITFCIIFFSGSIFWQIIGQHSSKSSLSIQGQVANVGPDHSMEVVIKTGEKSIIFDLKTEKQKTFSTK